MTQPRRSTAEQRIRRNGGFTVVESVITLAIFSLVAINVTLLTRAGAATAHTGSLLSMLQGELDQTVDRMQFALMAAHADEVQSINAFPLYSSRVDFAIDIGVDNGAVILGDPERIEWSPINARDGRVEWIRNPDDDENERSVTWSRSVPSVFEGETAGNGADDNQNGLFDEGGLAFTLPSENQDMVEIHLTVERADKEGNRVPKSKRIRVTCRN